LGKERDKIGKKGGGGSWHATEVVSASQRKGKECGLQISLVHQKVGKEGKRAGRRKSRCALNPYDGKNKRQPAL